MIKVGRPAKVRMASLSFLKKIEEGVDTKFKSSIVGDSIRLILHNTKLHNSVSAEDYNRIDDFLVRNGLLFYMSRDESVFEFMEAYLKDWFETNDLESICGNLIPDIKAYLQDTDKL